MTIGLANEILESRGMSVEQLLRFAPAVREHEALVLCGSIAEGLANVESDVDVLYLGERNLMGKFVMKIEGVSSIDVAHDDEGREINVERLCRAELEELRSRFLPGVQALEKPQMGQLVALEHDPWKLKILHRLRSAVVIRNSNAFLELVRPLHLEVLPAYLTALSMQWYLNAREDAWGEQKSDREKSAFYMVTHVAAPRLLAALLASLGHTNPDPKWHWLLAERIRGEVDSNILDPLMDLISGKQGASSPVEQLVAVASPVERIIYQRQRSVYKAMIGFSRLARYETPKF